MSAFVVTETGVVIEYPDAGTIHWINEKEFIAKLTKDSEGKSFVAMVPRGCIVSFSRPNVVQQARDAKQSTFENSLEIVSRCIDTMKTDYATRLLLKELKRKLANFDARSGYWK